MSLVHGLSGDLVAPHWPPLTLEEVRGVLRAYGRQARAVRWRSPRPLSSAGLVTTDRDVVFVKRHDRRVRTAADLAVEHAFAGHLRSRGVPAPLVLRTLSGASSVSGPLGTYEVHARAPGLDRYRDVLSWQPFLDPADAFATGSALARLSLAAEGFDAPARRPQVLVTGDQGLTATGLLSAVAARPLVAAALARRASLGLVVDTLAPLQERLAPHLPALDPGWTHGDGHPSNLLWSGADVTAVLDLGLSERTTPLLELATVLERSTIGWLDPSPAARLDLVGAVVRGWDAVRPRTPAEAAALPELLPLAHVDLALTELGYYEGVLGDRAAGDLAHDGYLLGHARWFAGPRGRALAHHLRGS